MMDNHNRKGCPRTAYELFLKLYCKKRGSSSEKNNLTLLAAARAWVTLKEEEKKTFIEKFAKCKEKHRSQIALRLEKMEPYMKKKQIKSCTMSDKSSIQDQQSKTKLGNFDKYEVPSPPNISSTIYEVTSIQDQQSNTETEKLEEYEEPILPEPTPPSVRKAIDLFNIIKNKKDDSNTEWTSLSKVEKMRYRKAVYELKKDYIKKYKMYLESLPSKELFKYYNSIEIS